MSDLNLELLAQHLIERRGKSNQRAAAREIGVSASTLCRVETGYAPDLETFGKLCAWLGKDPAQYLGLGVPEVANLIRVQLDCVLDVPGSRVGPLMEMPLTQALVMGLRAMGLNAKPASGGHRKLTSLESEKQIPRRLRREAT